MTDPADGQRTRTVGKTNVPSEMRFVPFSFVPAYKLCLLETKNGNQWCHLLDRDAEAEWWLSPLRYSFPCTGQTVLKVKGKDALFRVTKRKLRWLEESEVEHVTKLAAVQQKDKVRAIFANLQRRRYDLRAVTKIELTYCDESEFIDVLVRNTDVEPRWVPTKEKVSLREKRRLAPIREIWFSRAFAKRRKYRNSAEPRDEA